MLKNMRERYVRFTAHLGTAWVRRVVAKQQGPSKQKVLAYLDSGRYEKLLAETADGSYLFTGWIPWRLVHNIRVVLKAKEAALRDLQTFIN